MIPEHTRRTNRVGCGRHPRNICTRVKARASRTNLQTIVSRTPYEVVAGRLGHIKKSWIATNATSSLDQGSTGLVVNIVKAIPHHGAIYPHNRRM